VTTAEQVLSLALEETVPSRPSIVEELVHSHN
jgi:hypothetical protein